ncbi:hypothetical protein RRG08_033867 [Elysia crispata]|uniref:Uncharacterized protein n=1 Tax=Elysia crispata TaxID=231223 RepID=A0AAE1BA77_9GAST|nr:hypothetical protein RRG08_033867 [Elysia crispata]
MYQDYVTDPHLCSSSSSPPQNSNRYLPAICNARNFLSVKRLKLTVTELPRCSDPASDLPPSRLRSS